MDQAPSPLLAFIFLNLLGSPPRKSNKECSHVTLVRLGVETTSMSSEAPCTSSSTRMAAWAWPHPLSKASALQSPISCTFRSSQAPACACPASLLGLLQHTTAPPFHCALRNRHMRRDLAPHHGSSFLPSPCSLVSLQHGSTPLPSPLSRPLTRSHRTSRHCLLVQKPGLRTVQPLPASDNARQCPSRLA